MRIVLLLLMAAVFFSAIKLVQIRYENRLLFRQLQALEQQRDQLNMEWGQLQLEQSTWGQHSRIEMIARKKLHMRVPAANEVIYVKP